METNIGGLRQESGFTNSVRVGGDNRLKRFLAFAGPAYLVSVGYMDPGNWATDIAGGAKFGYALLWVIGVSNLMAMLLQTLCVRLGLATGRDLAQSCRDYYKKPAAIALWLGCEIAIIACDLAEVIGSAVAIYLLSGGRIPLVWGVLITGADVLLLLGLLRFGFRKIEAIILAMVATVAGCFVLQLFAVRPDVGAIAHGLFNPSLPGPQALLLAVGILGATVMPHNLYLHSSIVQTRVVERTPKAVRSAMRYATLDTIIALAAAFFVNASILIVAAAYFHATGRFDIKDLEPAHELLKPLLGGAAATAFAVALLASGQSSTITGTLAGQIVMEGFLHIRVTPWLRRLITRGLAIVPAILLISFSGRGDGELLVLSQVVLSMQLPFAVFPLVAFTSDKKRMGEFVNPAWLKWTGYLICAAISTLNINLLRQVFSEQFAHFYGERTGALLGWAALAGIAAILAAFSAWVTWVWKEKPSPAL